MGKIFGTKEMRILMLGLDAAGKTSEWPDLERGNGTDILTIGFHSNPLQIETHKPRRDDYSYRRVQRRKRYL